MLKVFLLFILSFAEKGILHPVRETQYGKVKGKYKRGLVHKHVEVFKSIPFAAPPVGNLRWRRPQAPQPWNHTLDADRNVICPQLTDLGLLISQEDCLYLDVYLPRDTKRKGPLPVMVWFYGGGFRLGDKEEFGWYDGSKLASIYDVVIVNPNYRIDVFGFLGHPAFAEEDVEHSTGNYGMQDQVFALEWVKKNIANFKGDPNKVTIWGESAGAFSVCTLLATPAAKGLFHRAIMESADCGSGLFHTKMEVRSRYSELWAEAYGDCSLKELGKDDWRKCLRSKETAKLLMPLTDILEVPPVEWQELAPLTNVMPWGPTIDKSWIFDTPYNVIKSGDWNKVPLLGGYNKNDGSMFVPAVPIVLRNTTLPLDTYKDLLAVAEHVYSNNATAAKLVADYYFSLKPNYTQEIGSVLLRDFVLHCYSRNSFQEAARQGVPVYTYYLDAKEPLWPLYWVLKDHHGMEMQFVWDNPTWIGSLIMPGTPRNQKIGTQVSEFFTNFAKYANPNGEGDSSGHKHTWPLYDVDTEPSLRIDKDFQAIYKQDTQQCEFWKSMLPYWVNM